MTATVHAEIPEEDWIDLAGTVGAENGRVSNSGNSTLVYVQAETKPDPKSTLGHRLVDDNLFDYVVASPESIWVRALHREGIASVTPDLAVGVLKGALDTHDADVHNAAVNKYLHQHTSTSTTVSTDSLVNDYQINVADTTGFIVGNALHINTGSVETTHPIITAITPGTPGVLILDRRLDKAHSVGDIVVNSIIDLASQIGTLATPQVYWAGPEPGEVWHITTLTVAMGHSSAGDLGLFGNLTKLTNGVVVRSFIGGNYGTLTNWKTNGDIDLDTGNVKFPVRSGGGGTHGTTTTGPFKDRTGAVLRLDGDSGDRFEIYVQDDLTGIIFWNMKVQGHWEGF